VLTASLLWVAAIAASYLSRRRVDDV